MIFGDKADGWMDGRGFYRGSAAQRTTSDRCLRQRNGIDEVWSAVVLFFFLI